MNHLTASWAMLAAATYFHASPRDFQPGDVILPTSQTGVAKTFGETGRADRVYLTDTEADGWEWASIIADFPGPLRDAEIHVYEVEPLGPVETQSVTEGDGLIEHLTTSARVKRRLS